MPMPPPEWTDREIDEHVEYAVAMVSKSYEFVRRLGMPHMTLHGIYCQADDRFNSALTRYDMEVIMNTLDMGIFEESILPMPDGYWMPGIRRGRHMPPVPAQRYQWLSTDILKTLPWRKDWHSYLRRVNVPGFRAFRTTAPQPCSNMASGPVAQPIIPAKQSPRGAGEYIPLSPKTRYTILKRDSFRCRICGVSCTDGDDVRLEIDHITPRVLGGNNDHSNLWTLCFPCNRGKGVDTL